MISIIIPTFQEEGFISACIQNILNKAKHDIEIIVIDAGSTDKTEAIVKSFSQVVFDSKSEFKGKKYASLNYGAGIANGEILLFLDADTLLPEKFDTHIIENMESGFHAGAFKLDFDKSHFLLTILLYFNELRYVLTREYFGDQGIWIDKKVFSDVGGFPELNIMEAPELCKILKQDYKLKLINAKIISSSRRFYNNGFLNVFLIDLKIYLMSMLGMNLANSAERYWKVK